MANNKKLLPAEIISSLDNLQVYRFVWVFFLNFCIICIGMLLLSSEWLSPPGISVNIPTSTLSSLTIKPTTHVITIDSNDRIFFNKRFYSIDSIKDVLLTKSTAGRRLLVKADADISIDITTKVINIAYENGFDEVQLAVSEK